MKNMSKILEKQTTKRKKTDKEIWYIHIYIHIYIQHIYKYIIYIYIFIYIYNRTKIGDSEAAKRQVFPKRFDGGLFEGNLSICEFYRFT